VIKLQTESNYVTGKFVLRNYSS